jgi:hypothetical protein
METEEFEKFIEHCSKMAKDNSIRGGLFAIALALTVLATVATPVPADKEQDK